MNNYICYCDGAYSSAKNQGGIGIVIVKDNVPILKYSKMYPDTTNNRMEIQAIITALKCIKNPIDSLTIYSDSQYCIGCITKGWKRKMNQDLWKIFDDTEVKAKELISSLNYEWVHGHADSEYNNMADSLAVKASQELNN